MATDTRPLLSRVADSLYWMARYMERAENVARLLEVNLHLQLDLPLDGNQWQPVIDTCGESAVFRKRYGEATQESVVAFLAQDRDYSNSITSCLLAARENARSVRETISFVSNCRVRRTSVVCSPEHENPHRQRRTVGARNGKITDSTPVFRETALSVNVVGRSPGLGINLGPMPSRKNSLPVALNRALSPLTVAGPQRN